MIDEKCLLSETTNLFFRQISNILFLFLIIQSLRRLAAHNSNIFDEFHKIFETTIMKHKYLEFFQNFSIFFLNKWFSIGPCTAAKGWTQQNEFSGFVFRKIIFFSNFSFFFFFCLIVVRSCARANRVSFQTKRRAH